MNIIIKDSLGNSKEFTSKTEAARFLGVNESSVRKAIRKGSYCKGYLCYLKEPNQVSLKENLFISSIPKPSLPEIGTHLILPDMHIPYFNTTLLNKIVRMMGNNTFVGLHILGDFLDLSSLSSYDYLKRNKGITLSEEYEMGNSVLNYLTQNLPKNSSLSYIAGNHELRYRKYMMGSEAAKLGTALLSPTVALKLKERGFNVIEEYPDGYVQLGNVQLIHGMYLNSNHAKTHLQKVRSNVMYGHSHQLQVYSENGLTAYNIGHLVDAEAPIFSYASRFEKVNWKSGFATITLDYEGNTHVQVIEPVNDSFVYNGVIY